MTKQIQSIFLILVLILFSCQNRDWTNPFDPSCPKEIWTPKDFKVVQEGTTIKLTWNQPIPQVSGYKITKSVNGGTNTSLPDLGKGINQLVDNTLIGGKIHSYSLTAFAGANLSNTVTTSITPILTAAITTAEVSAIDTSSVTSGGTINSDGGAPITARGVCWSKNQNPTIADSKTSNGTGNGSFTSNITGLTHGTTYYIRAYSTNSAGTSYGNQVTVVTLANLPVLSTATVSSVTMTGATGGGTITSDGGGAITARGVCWNTLPNPTISNSKTSDSYGSGIFTSAITGLSPNTAYYVRAYATNSAGTAYGQQEICVSSYGTVTDIEGNIYQTLQIGTQIWTRENLKTTKYKDGNAIPLVIDNTVWQNLTTPGYCWYNNDASSNKNVYGAIYNWFTVNSNTLCPTGWHVPTDIEWITLISFLGGETVAGGKLKESGTMHWASPNTGATNESGFTALPGGYRGFGAIGSNCYWWSSTEVAGYYALDRYIEYNKSSFSGYFPYKQNGNYVRCLYGELPVSLLTTNVISGITTVSAVSGGNISSDGGTLVTARGVCWNTTASPTIANSKTNDGSGTGDFTSNITGLAAGTTYYARAYATSSAGTAYGNQVNFTTTANQIVPTFANIGPLCQNSSAPILPSSSSNTPAITGTWSPTIISTANAGTTTFTFTPSAGQNANTVTISIQIIAAITPSFAVFGPFCLNSPAPPLPTTSINGITGIWNPSTISTATSGTRTLTFTPATGQCASVMSIDYAVIASINPTFAVIGPFTQNSTAPVLPLTSSNGITGKWSPSIIYTAAVGTITYTFTPDAGQCATVETMDIVTVANTMTDVEGNVYPIVTIGLQVWMASNLKTLSYNDNTAIPLVTDNTKWINLISPGYCWYNNDATTNKSTYGAMYNWYTVNTGKLCPIGWHIPSETEWKTQTLYLLNGGKLKESGTSHWLSPNTGATNETGFSALPGGYRFGNGTYSGIGEICPWWSATEFDTVSAWTWSVSYNSISEIGSPSGKGYGLFVRCIKD